MDFEPKAVLYSIVVVGQMNPPIHHPAWYRQIKFIDQDEEKSAVEDPGFATTPLASTFKVPTFQITCIQNRWDIKTNDSGQRQKIRSFAERMFDEILPHTPVAAFGFNFDLVFDARGRDIGKYLADQLARSVLNIGFIEPSDAEIRVSDRRSSHTFNYFIKSHKDAQEFHVNVNYHYLIPTDNPAPFSLKEKFHPEFDQRFHEAESVADLTAKQILQD